LNIAKRRKSAIAFSGTIRGCIESLRLSRTYSWAIRYEQMQGHFQTLT
jgi:hypothetical protein